MKFINDWSELARAIGPYLMTEDPLASLRADGFMLGAELTHAIHSYENLRERHREPAARLHPPRRDLETRLQIGAAFEELTPAATSGYGTVATVDLAVLNEVLAVLYAVETFPHALSPTRSEQVIDLPTLRSLCTGVPEGDAKLICRFESPLLASASSASQLQLHLRISIAQEIQLPTMPALVGVLEAEIPLQFEVTDGRIRPQVGIESLMTARFQVADASVLQPRSDAAHDALSAKFLNAARGAVAYLRDKILHVAASIPINTSSFPNSTIDVTQVGAVVIRQSGRDYAVIGLNVERLRNGDELNPIGLIGQLTPMGVANLRVVFDEESASDTLASVILSGDLSAFFNRVIARNAHGFKVSPVVVTGGSIHLRDGQVRTSLDCIFKNACQFGMDLKFTATMRGTATVAAGKLTITGGLIDLNIDDSDAVLCWLLSGLTVPFNTALYSVLLDLLSDIGLLGMLRSSFLGLSLSDLSIPVGATSEPLSGSDKVLFLELQHATMEPGVLMAEGQLQLIRDPLRIFAHLQVINTFMNQDVALVGATVELYELDNPAPAGDDVVDPSSFTETLTPIAETTEEVVFTPRADQLLGSGMTDDHGRISFVVIGNDIGGSAQHTRSQENLRTHHVTVTTRTELVGEQFPDLAVTIRLADGVQVTQRQLIALNLQNNRLGLLDHPVEVRVSVVPRNL